LGLERLFFKTGKELFKLTDGFGGLGKTIGSVFGISTGGAAKTAKNVADAAGGAKIAASTIANSIGGIISSATGVVSAISGVIGNFQMAKQESSLNAIELNTRKTTIFMGEQPQSLLWCAQKSTEYLGYVVGQLDVIGQLLTSGRLHVVTVADGAGGGGGTTVNMAGAYLLTDAALEDFVDRMAVMLKRRGF
jgi:hypothetical protein